MRVSERERERRISPEFQHEVNNTSIELNEEKTNP
jgi:hypothetical protein